MDNIIYATFKEGKGDIIYTKRTFQYNRGVKLRVSGVALPEKYQVHFANNENEGVSAAIWVSGSDIPIPDAYFQTGDYVYVWIYFAEDGKNAAGISMYKVIVPVEKRPAILSIGAESGGMVIDAELDEDDHTLIFH